MASIDDSTETMLAAVLENFGEPYTIKRIPRPHEPEGYDIIVKVLAASYCHTDAVFASGAMSQDLPRVGCHEFSGEVVALGPDVSDTRGIVVGMRVGVPGRAYRPCGTCYECMHPGQDELGYSPYCLRAGNLGLTRDGGFQEYCLVDSRQVAPLPDGLSATQAAPLMCAGLTIWAALHHNRVENAQRVGIIGAGGGLGHLGVQFAAQMGREVLAIDVNDQSLDLLRRIKIDLGPVGTKVQIVDARNATNLIKAVGQQDLSTTPSTETGLDAVILLTESITAFDTGMKLLRNHGTMVVVSFPKEKFAVNSHDLVFRDISIVGSLVGRNHQLREMLNFSSQNNIAAEINVFPLAHLNQAVKEHQKGAGKLVIDMTL